MATRVVHVSRAPELWTVNRAAQELLLAGLDPEGPSRVRNPTKLTFRLEVGNEEVAELHGLQWDSEHNTMVLIVMLISPTADERGLRGPQGGTSKMRYWPHDGSAEIVVEDGPS